MTRVAEGDEKAGRQEGKGAVCAATLAAVCCSAAALRSCSRRRRRAEFVHTGGNEVHGDGVKHRVELHLPAGITGDTAVPGNEMLTMQFCVRGVLEKLLECGDGGGCGGVSALSCKLLQQMFNLSFTCVSEL